MTEHGNARGHSGRTILIIDDFAAWRAQLRQILVKRPEWNIIAEACDGLEGVRLATELQPDIVLLDLSMPTVNGIDAAKMIRERCPKSKIVVVTQNIDDEIKEVVIAAGASGYVVKMNAAHELLEAIATALRNP